MFNNESASLEREHNEKRKTIKKDSTRKRICDVNKFTPDIIILPLNGCCLQRCRLRNKTDLRSIN